MVPTVNDVALTGPDGVNPWPRGPNHFGGYQLDGRLATLQEQALGALTNHAQAQQRATTADPRRPGLVSTRAVHEPSRSGAGRSGRRRHDAVAGSRSARLNADRGAGQGGVHPRLRALPRWPRPIDGAGAARPISRHRDPVSSSGRHRDATALRVRAVRARSRAQRPYLRDHVDQRNDRPAHELGSWPCVADRLRRRRRANRRLEQVRYARTSRDQQDRPVLPQQQRRRPSRRWSITTSSSSSA